MSIFLEKSISKELSGSWNLSIKAIASEYTAPNRSDLITEEGESFRVIDVNKVREFEETYIEVEARHVCFDLEKIYVTKGKVTPDYDRTDIIIDKGFDGWQVDYQLKGTLSDHLSELFKFVSGFTVGTAPATDERTVSISEGSVFKNLKIILDRFNCGYDFSGTTVNAYKYSTKISQASSGRVAYSENNINMSRSLNYDDVVGKLYAEAVIVPAAAEKYHKIEEKGSGHPEYFVDFGELETETELSSLATAYYNIRSDPQPRYTVDVAEISLLSDQLPDGQVASDYSFSVGDVVTVTDSELSISENMVVVGYDYSLITDAEDSYTSQVKLGTLDKERLPPDFEIFKGGMNKAYFKARTNADDVKELVNMLKKYIEENVFGGDIKKLDGELINYASRHSLTYPSGLGWNGGFISGSGTFAGLDNIITGFSAYIGGTETTKTSDIEIFNPSNYVKEAFEDFVSRWDFSDLMKFWIDTYIDSATDIATQLNSIYDSVHSGSGSVTSSTIENEPTDIMQRIEDMENLGILWKSEATSVINYALSQAGNPTDVYTEIGGGKNGYIPCIHKLWQEVKNVSISDVAADESETLRDNRPKIYTSTEDPIETKGENGDIWLKYEVSS